MIIINGLIEPSADDPSITPVFLLVVLFFSGLDGRLVGIEVGIDEGDSVGLAVGVSVGAVVQMSIASVSTFVPDIYKYLNSTSLCWVYS